jgi:FMN phosphatase YigB (HAD superfamily)
MTRPGRSARRQVSELDRVFKPQTEVALIDFGGVLCHYVPTPECLDLTRQHLGRSVHLTRWLFNHPASRQGLVGRLSAEDVLRQTAARAGLPVETVFQIWTAFVAANVVDAALLDALQRYRRRARVFILTNYWSNARDVIFSKIPRDAVDGVFVSAELGMKKPQRSLWRHLIGAFGRPPGALALLDDEEPNIRAASSAGLSGHLWVRR